MGTPVAVTLEVERLDDTGAAPGGHRVLRAGGRAWADEPVALGPPVLVADQHRLTPLPGTPPLRAGREGPHWEASYRVPASLLTAGRAWLIEATLPRARPEELTPIRASDLLRSRPPAAPPAPEPAASPLAAPAELAATPAPPTAALPATPAAPPAPEPAASPLAAPTELAARPAPPTAPPAATPAPAPAAPAPVPAGGAGGSNPAGELAQRLEAALAAVGTLHGQADALEARLAGLRP